MRVLLTGGAGDLGQVLLPRLISRGDTPVILDIRTPSNVPSPAAFIQGSVLDRASLPDHLLGCDCIVHIAAWHGIHESRGEKSAYDFFDLDVRGTFEVFEAAAKVGIDKIVYISTTSIYRPDTLYGRAKLLAERIADDYVKYRGMNVITLRPRAFIPHWNRAVYADFIEWARWFWRGAVHVDDVAAAVLLSIDRLSQGPVRDNPKLPLDGAYEYTDADLAHWDEDGAGSTFRKRYPDYYDLALSHGLDPAVKPNRLDIAETVRCLGYQPSYGLARLLAELARHGAQGPPEA